MSYAAHKNKSGSAAGQEQLRLEALRSYNVLDTLPEQELDDITRLASAICEMPISLITLIDSDRQWFKSRYGLPGDASETPLPGGDTSAAPLLGGGSSAVPAGRA